MTKKSEEQLRGQYSTRIDFVSLLLEIHFLIDFMVLYYSWIVGFSKFSLRSTSGWNIPSGFWVWVGKIFSFPTWLTLDLFIVITYLALYKPLIVARIQRENISEHHRKNYSKIKSFKKFNNRFWDTNNG